MNQTPTPPHIHVVGQTCCHNTYCFELRNPCDCRSFLETRQLNLIRIKQLHELRKLQLVVDPKQLAKINEMRKLNGDTNDSDSEKSDEEL